MRFEKGAEKEEDSHGSELFHRQVWAETAPGHALAKFTAEGLGRVAKNARVRLPWCIVAGSPEACCGCSGQAEASSSGHLALHEQPRFVPWGLKPRQTTISSMPCVLRPGLQDQGKLKEAEQLLRPGPSLLEAFVGTGSDKCVN